MFERLRHGNGTDSPGIEIERELPWVRFACDLPRCKGACCVIPGGRGAPLLDEEIPLLRSVLGATRDYLSARSLSVLDREGPVSGTPGDRCTTCVDDRDCVFVCYQDSIATCSLERAYFEKGTSWRKPLSCHLFPIRIDRNGSLRLRYESLGVCEPAILNGEEKGIYLTEFLEDALVRAVGRDRYGAIVRYCGLVRGEARRGGGVGRS